MQICVENLQKTFKIKTGGFLKARKVTNVEAVQNVSFEVEKGEIVAFIGPNGAGKSTTIKMLTGIIQPSGGKISVAGFNPSTQRKKLAYHVGCMFGQKSQLYMHLTVRDSYKLLCSIYDMNEEQANKKIAEIAEMFKIEELLDKVVRKLSLGQRMICEIAGSILHEPEIIFLDEPTIGLDIFAKARIRQIIKKMNEEKGTTIFLTSHDLGDVEALENMELFPNWDGNGKEYTIGERVRDEGTGKDLPSRNAEDPEGDGGNPLPHYGGCPCHLLQYHAVPCQRGGSVLAAGA